MLAHSHKPAGPQTQMSLGGGGAMQQPARAQPPASGQPQQRLGNPSEPPVSYYPQRAAPLDQQQQQQHQNHHQHHYQLAEHPNEMVAQPGAMIARRTGPPQPLVYGSAPTNGNQLPAAAYQQQQQQPAAGYQNGAEMAPLPQPGARRQSPYLQQQQQQQQPIPVRHNQQQQQQLVSEPPTMQQQQQHQRSYARPTPTQPHANFNPSVNTSNQAPAQQVQVQQPHQQPLMGGPGGGDLMAPGGDSFAQSSAPLLQQQLNRQRASVSQLPHEPAAHYQLDGPIQQQQQHHANFGYQQQQQQPNGRPMSSHKQRPMQASGQQRPQQPQQQQQQRQQVIAAPQLQQQLDAQPQQQFPCNPTPPLTPNRLAGGAPAHQQQHQDDWSLGYPQQPVNGAAGNYHQEAPPAPAPHQVKHRIHQMPKSQPAHQAPASNAIQYHAAGPPGHFIGHQALEQQATPVISHKPAAPMSGALEQQIRLTLPLREGALLGPFKLEHDVQFATKSFHLRPQLFEQLSKAAMQQQQQAAAVIQELQFRAYLSTEPMAPGNNSLLAANQQQPQPQRPAHTNSCQWPEMFQVSCNQQLVHLDRSTMAPGARLAHRAADIFPYCQPGDNLLELQVNSCYCSHEFVLELVDRPTLKAFMNSCFKTRLLSNEACLAKLGALFGKPGFSCQLPAAGIINEYVTEYLIQPNGQQVEQTRLKISLRCPLSGRRMRTPTRGPHCKHLQCFDLENFLFANRERTRWSCPICALPVPFNMLELDQHQMGICQAMAAVARTDEVLVNSLGQWQSYQPGSPPPAPPMASQAQVYQHQAPPPSAKANGTTFHPHAPTGGAPGRPSRGPVGSAAHWDQQQQQQQPQQQLPASPPVGVPVRRPPSSMGAQQSASKAKRSLNNNATNNQAQYQSAAGPMQAGPPQHQTNFMEPQVGSGPPEAELSPLAAMERTIIHHEQQMGPPPFDANILTASSSPLRSGAPQGPSGGAAAHSSPSSANNSFASPLHHQPSPPDAMQLMSQQQQQQQHQAVSSPLRQVPASPQHQPGRMAQSPLQQQSSSKPATPLLHAAPETPATPGQPGNMQPQSMQQQQPLVQQQNVDHQPLSNGSASAASITSTSTMTPSGQSLGSVGMGGDSRCNTAPLQNPLGSLDDLVQVPNSGGQLLSSSSPYGANKQQMAAATHQQQQHLQHQQFDDHRGPVSHSSNSFEAHHLDERADKGDMLMSNLMMEATGGESGQPSELALALEEAEWKQQLDRGKSEHLANFLNEPLMNKKPALHHHQGHFAGPSSHQLTDNSSELDGTNKLLSAGLGQNNDDDALNQLSPARGFGVMGSPTSELLADQLDQQHQHPLDSYANYLDSNGADDGAGLPPDDSILDLFER